MRFETVIIGGGLAGLVCGIKLAKAGKKCAIVSSGQSALHFSSGSFDLLSSLENGEKVDSPVAAIAKLPECHPYSLLGAEKFAELAESVPEFFAECGVSLKGDCKKNHYRMTPMGTLKPTWLTINGYVTSDNEEKIPYDNVTLFNAEGFLDFYTTFISDVLKRSGVKCAVKNFTMPALENIRKNPTEMRSSNIAKMFDHSENVVELCNIINREKGDCQAVLLPAFLGFEDKHLLEKIEETIGCKVLVIATLPPSVPGLQTQMKLRRVFEKAGGTYFLGDSALSFEAEGSKIASIKTINHGDVSFRADNFVLATGSFFSRGLIANKDGIIEPLFNIDVYSEENRGNWYNEDLMAPQPFEKFGVRFTDEFKAVKNGNAIENLYVIGAGLSGFNPLSEGCGAGVSILTAMAVAEKLM